MQHIHRVFFILCIFGFVSAVPSFARAAEVWPASSAVGISSVLQSTGTPSGRAFEPSDATMFGGQLMLVSDEGDVATMDRTGADLAEWLTTVGADLEGVTVVGDTVYVLHERARDVLAYSLSTHALLATYDLSSWISGDDNLGPEALAFHDGNWLVGHQVTGTVYAFDLSGAEPVLRTTWESGMALTALTSAADGNLYALGSGKLRQYRVPGGEYTSYLLPSGLLKPEGVALQVDCATNTASVFIADDAGPVYRYDNFPVTCAVAEPDPTPVPIPVPVPVDADGDGAVVEDDCNDTDPAVSTMQTYYRDADADTLGSTTAIVTVCAGFAPAGYVTNANDTNDAQAYFSAKGMKNGSIDVTYGNGTVATYTIFNVRTSRLTSVSQYKDSANLVAIDAGRRYVSVVDPYSGVIIATHRMLKSSALTKWLVGIIGY